MKRLFIILLISATTLSTGCATRKFVKKEVGASSDALSARIDTNEGEIGEVRDSVHKAHEKITGVDGRVTTLDTKTNQLKTDVDNVDQKAAAAQTAADRVAGDVVTLDQKFNNRNQFTIAAEKSVQFKFNGAVLDKPFKAMLDEVADSLAQNPDVVIVLEGRTDSRGDSEYNVRLGERRVEAVKRYLAVEKNVPIYRIHQISFGSAKPIADNKSRDGREKNRAVKMMILVPRTEATVTWSSK